MNTTTSDARTRLRRLGQADLGKWVEIACGTKLWSVQKRIATAVSKPKARVNVPSCYSSGKFLRNSEPVLTPSGWTPIGDIAVGDRVIAVDGQPTTVVGVFPQGPQQLYRVTFNDGTSVDAGGEHLWAVKLAALFGVEVFTTDQLRALVGRPGYVLRLPVLAPVVQDGPVPTLDAYTAGALLGDGHIPRTGTPSLSTADPEMLDHIPHPVKAVKVAGGRCPRYNVSGISDLLTELDMRQLAWDKFVPQPYLRSDAPTRLAVLQGLLDTDGGVSGLGVEFSSTSEQLAQDVAYLTRSLGGWAGKLRILRPTYTSKGEKLTSYRVALVADFPLFRISRKVAQHDAIRADRSRAEGKIIDSITEIDIDEATCIAVSHPDRLYVTRDFTVTHNTHIAAKIALAFYDAYTPGVPCAECKGPCGGAKVITTSSKEQHLKDNLWGEIRTSWNLAQQNVGMDGKLPPADIWISHTPEHFIIGQVATSSEGVQGYHGAHLLVIGDEASSVSAEVALGIQGILASGDARLLLIYNPTSPDTYAAQQSRLSRTELIRITAFDTPEFTGEERPPGSHFIDQSYLDDLIEQGCGPGTYEWETRILAKFWDATDDTLVAESWYLDALKRPASRGHRAFGIDIASYGSAENIVAVRDGNALVELKAFPSGRVDHFFQGPVTQMIREWRPNDVIYDADGVGAGAVGYAEALGRHMHGGRIIGFRGAKKYGDAYTNSRSQWYWHLRRLFESGGIAVTLNDPKLQKQLTNIKYSIQNGAIRLETKEEMRRRGLPSPDRADGVYYAFSMSSELYVPEEPKSMAEDVFDLRRDWRSDRDDWGKNDDPVAPYHPILGVEDW